MKIKTNFMGNTFETQNKFKIYIQDFIYKEIGYCNNIKDKLPEKYNKLIELLKRHPEWKSKSNDMVNIETEPNERKYCPKYNMQSVHISIVKENGKKVDISWNSAIKGKSKTPEQNLVDAMRKSIEPQTTEFKKKSVHKCELCDKRDCSFHVDHYKPQFNELKNDFIKDMKNITIPKSFDDNNDFTPRFTQNDKEFEREWISFHKEKAILRILCENCNLCRKKATNK